MFLIHIRVTNFETVF